MSIRGNNRKKALWKPDCGGVNIEEMSREVVAGAKTLATGIFVTQHIFELSGSTAYI